MMKSSVNRVKSHIFEHIVHPAHVPLKAEPQSPQIGGGRHHGEGGAFLRDHHNAAEVMIDSLVQAAEEVDAVQILPPAVAVGQVLSRFLAEVIVDDAADRVHPQAVGVIPVHPETGVGEQKAAHLAPGKVEQLGAPLGDLAPAAVGMIVETGAVKAVQADLILGKVAGHPVQDHADARLMAAVDEIHELLGRSIPGGGGVVTRHLISPTHVQRVLHHWKQLDMGVAHVQHVGDQFVRQLCIGIEASVRVPAPGTHVHFVNVYRALIGIEIVAGLEPLRVAPFVAFQIVQTAGVAGPQLAVEGVRVGFHAPDIVRPPHGVFVGGVAVLRCVVPEGLLIQPKLPGAVVLLFHGVGAAVVMVKGTDQRHVFRVGSPNAEMPLTPASLLTGMRAKHFIGAAAEPLMKCISDSTRWSVIPHRSVLLYGLIKGMRKRTLLPLPFFNYSYFMPCRWFRQVVFWKKGI